MAAESFGIWIWIGSILAGIAAAWAAVWVLQELTRPDPAALLGFEEDRRARLRASSRFCARFERAISSLAARDRKRHPGPRPWLAAMLAAAGESDWTPSEFLAASDLKGGAAAVVAGLYGLWGQGSVVDAAVASTLAFGVWRGLALWSLRKRGQKRRKRILARLPFVVDLLALMLEAGGHLLAAIGTAAREMENHPLADELGQVHRAIGHGIPTAEALKAMADRVGLPALSEFVSAVTQAEAGGTKIADTFRVQAEQMRIRRSQAIEAAASRASVDMVYPQLILMLTCLLLIGSLFLTWMMMSAEGTA